ncbi:putative CheW protein [Planktothrix sp. PCC 11201]|uniref:chemotaxis protein CheW n=1 Tax=Planktothrix sp. PCC 11201 TaxID=1729650 RepID=UPI00091297C7|nr:chemotaxis protein CheW [Planktothrix sp. PCC 11201]SKB11508.1 putative CheW protein [Planktothrix sp. PCC 11201]
MAYLIFALKSMCYAIMASVVEEIFFLPELTPIPAAPADLVGLINLRGELLPVIDLTIRLGYPEPNYALSDSVIILKFNNIRLGIIVTQVSEVKMIANDEIKTELAYNFQQEFDQIHPSYYLQGVAQVDEHLVMVLNPETLIQYISHSLPDFNLEKINPEGNQSPIHGESSRKNNFRKLQNYIFSTDATPEERQIFQERAKNLRHPIDDQDFAGLVPLAVISLNGEYFGVNLEIIREFTDIHHITPIPCTPPHIVGNMNLRGEILTLVNIRGLVNLPLQTSQVLSKAMIVKINDIVAGIIVEGIFDVIYLKESEIKTIPTAVHLKQDEYLQGTAFYQDKMISILNVAKIMTQGELFVDQEV